MYLKSGELQTSDTWSWSCWSYPSRSCSRAAQSSLPLNPGILKQARVTQPHLFLPNQGWICPPAEVWQCLETIVTSGQRSGMWLDILPCTGHTRQQSYTARNVNIVTQPRLRLLILNMSNRKIPYLIFLYHILWELFFFGSFFLRRQM